MKDLQKLRKKIDSIDDKIVKLLGKRAKITEEVARHKVKAGLPLRDEVREAGHLVHIESRAHKAGLDVNFARSVIQTIMNEARRKHEIIAKDLKK